MTRNRWLNSLLKTVSLAPVSYLRGHVMSHEVWRTKSLMPTREHTLPFQHFYSPHVRRCTSFSFWASTHSDWCAGFCAKRILTPANEFLKFACKTVTFYSKRQETSIPTVLEEFRSLNKTKQLFDIFHPQYLQLIQNECQWCSIQQFAKAEARRRHTVIGPVVLECHTDVVSNGTEFGGGVNIH